MNEHDMDIPRVSDRQLLLFPRKSSELCADLKIPRWQVLKLYEDGLLSFDPELRHEHMTEAQVAELTFLTVLLQYEFPESILLELLQSLGRPYAYRFSDMYYDWPRHCWKSMPDKIGEKWLDELIAEQDVDKLNALRDHISDALERLEDE